MKERIHRAIDFSLDDIRKALMAYLEAGKRPFPPKPEDAKLVMGKLTAITLEWTEEVEN